MTTTVDPAPTATPFSTVIRTASRGEHQEAESTGFGQAMVEGRLKRDAYAALVAQTYLLYVALEEAAEVQRADPVGQTFWFPELLRVPSLERDLDFLSGPDWRVGLEPTPATAAYVARVREVAHTSSAGFMAHQYTRYLGDLSGGQIIGRNLQKAYGFDLDGVRFFKFDDIPKPKVFKDAYRARVDAAPWSDEEHAWIVEEIKLAFRLNTAMYDDLAGRLDEWLLPA